MERDTAVFSEDDVIQRLESFIGIIEKTAPTIENEEDRKGFLVRGSVDDICPYLVYTYTDIDPYFVTYIHTLDIHIYTSYGDA